MKKASSAWSVLLSLALLGLCACLLLSGAKLRRDGGTVEIRKVALTRGAGTFYRSVSEEAGTLMPGALILHTPGDGAEILAVELSRRGVAVLTASSGADAAEAWDWLTHQSFVLTWDTALMARRARCTEALALSGALEGSPSAPAAVILLGDDSLPERAAGIAGKNMLLLTGARAPLAGRIAFLGDESAAERGFTGYFSEGTARAAEALGGSVPSYGRGSVLARIIDWQGSALGHSIELADDDLVATQLPFCRGFAAVALLGAAAPFLLRRKE